MRIVQIQSFLILVVVFAGCTWIFGSITRREIEQQAAYPKTQLQKLVALDQADSAFFGNWVSMSGDGQTVVVGAYQNEAGGSPLSARGAAYVLSRSGSTWIQTTKLTASDPEDNAQFGAGVSISRDGNTIAVGADQASASGTAGSQRGAAYIFVRSGNLWNQQAKLEAIDQEDSARLGSSVALSADGNTVVVGALYDDASGTVGADRGAAYVFVRSGGTWVQQAKLTASDQEDSAFFGTVQISDAGDTVIVGAQFDDANGAVLSNRGAVYIYTRLGTIWSEQAKLMASDQEDNATFGISVALSASGDVALIGAFDDDASGSSGADRGTAYLFRRAGSVWSQEKKFEASDQENNGYFGIAVALSQDGRTALIGSSGHDMAGSASADRGNAYAFTKMDSTWTERSKLFSSDLEDSAFFGVSVALSADGSFSVVGASNSKASGAVGSNRGAVYFFGP